MGAVVALVVMVMGHIQARIHVVEGIGNLLAAVQLVRRQLHGAGGSIAGIGVQGFQHPADFLLGQGILCELRSCRKGGMVQIQARINDGNPHPLAGIAQRLPSHSGAKGFLGGVHAGVTHGGSGGGHVCGHIILLRHEGIVHPVQLPDAFQSAVGDFQGQTAEGHIVVIAHSKGRIRLRSSGRLCSQPRHFTLDALHRLADFLNHGILGRRHRFYLAGHPGPIGGNLVCGKALIQQRLFLQNHNHPDRLVLVIKRFLHLLASLVPLQVHAGIFNFLCRHLRRSCLLRLCFLRKRFRQSLRLQPVFSRDGSCGCLLVVCRQNLRWKQGGNHAQNQQEGKYTVHSFHIRLLLLLQLPIAAEDCSRLSAGGAASGKQIAPGVAL